MNKCYKCGTELVDTPGIGLFCPNKSCDVLDGPFVEVEELTTWIKEGVESRESIRLTSFSSILR